MLALRVAYSCDLMVVHNQKLMIVVTGVDIDSGDEWEICSGVLDEKGDWIVSGEGWLRKLRLCYTN